MEWKLGGFASINKFRSKEYHSGNPLSIKLTNQIEMYMKKRYKNINKQVLNLFQWVCFSSFGLTIELIDKEGSRREILEAF